MARNILISTREFHQQIFVNNKTEEVVMAAAFFVT
jgi:hypothetical protein